MGLRRSRKAALVLFGLVIAAGAGIAHSAPDPDTTITLGPAANIKVDTATFEFISDDPLATFECQLDLGGFAACTSPDVLTGLSEGSHDFQVRAVDQLAVPDPTPAEATFRVDLTVPTIAFDSITAANSYGWNNTDVVVTWTCTDPGVDPSGAPATVSVTVATEGAGQSATAHCTDAAGNDSIDDSVGGINIDKTKPLVIISGPGLNPNPAEYIGEADDVLSGLLAGGSGRRSPVSIQLVTLTGAEPIAWGGPRTTRCASASCPLGALRDFWTADSGHRQNPGVYMLRASVTDLAGNVGVGSTAVTFLPLI